MNYEETRQVALMRVVEMGRVLGECGLRLRDEYTFNDALEYAGMRTLEVMDDGYAAMLTLLTARSHTGRRVSDDVLFVDARMPLSGSALERLVRDVSALARHPLRIENLHIKYSVVYRPYKKRRIKSSNISADVSFDLPDAPMSWRITSAVDEDIASIPNIKNAHVGDTIINSPSEEWRMQAGGVALLSHIGECLMRSGAQLGLYFLETDEGCYVIAKSPGDIYQLKSRTGLAFFPVPEPDYDDELYERDEEQARASEMDALTRPTVADDEPADARLGDEFDRLIAEFYPDSADAPDAARDSDLPEIASPSPADAAAPREDEEELSSEMDAELNERLGYESEAERTIVMNCMERVGQALGRALMLPGPRAELREREYMEVRDQLVQLAQRGLRMNSGYLLREVIKSEGIKPYRLKRMGWEGLMWFLCGVDRVGNEIKPYSDDIMLYDYRDYHHRRLLIELTRNIQRMTRGELHFGSVSQRNDRYGRPAVFEFVQGGRKHKWRLRTDTGGAQLTDYFEHMAELMRDNGCSGNLWYFERRSKCYYMYLSHKNGLRLRRLTGLPLQAVLRD